MTERPYQYPLDLHFDPTFSCEDFIVSHCNEKAIEWIKRWEEWPNNSLLIVGPSGCGKTHLQHIWQQLTGALSIKAMLCKNSGDTTEEMKGRSFTLSDCQQEGFWEHVASAPAVILDDAHTFMGDPEQEEMLFHLLNTLRSQEKAFLIAATHSPTLWGVTLPDLASRLNALMLVHIDAPDDTLIRQLFVKQMGDQHLDVPAEVVEYLILRMERSYSAIRSMVTTLCALNLSNHQRITVPLARQALAHLTTQ